MVEVMIRMHAFPVKRRELLLVLQGLMEMLQKEQGFLRARLWTEAENKNIFILNEEWKTRDDIDRYIRQSNYYRVLLGAQQLLAKSSQITVDVVSQTEGMELMYAVPGDSKEMYRVETTV